MRAGKVIPFLGAGASIIGRPTDATWSADQSNFPPSGRELSRFLAEETMFPSDDPYDRDDLAKVSSYYTEISGRSLLRNLLHEKLNRQYPIGELHRLIADVPVPQLIVVTNYDTLLERAFDEVGKPYDLVVHPEETKEYANAVLWRRHGANEATPIAPGELARHVDLGTTTVIYKIHGTLDTQDASHDSFVITEEDYIEFLSRMTAHTAIPPLFTAHFRERNFLFLGYSLRDWNLRVVLRDLLKVRSEKLPAWAIQRGPSELECKLWDRRDVNIFDQTLDEFAAKLRRLQAA
jgi:hypothetical protein